MGRLATFHLTIVVGPSELQRIVWIWVFSFHFFSIFCIFPVGMNYWQLYDKFDGWARFERKVTSGTILFSSSRSEISQKRAYIQEWLKSCTNFSPIHFYLGPVQTYPDIFESATFSFPIRKYSRPHVMWSQRIHVEFAHPHVFGFTVPPGTGSTRSNPESSRTALLSYSFKLFQPAVLSGR